MGVKPTYEEVQAFVNDPAPKAYEKLIDQLLASPHYGERWGRHWLDVARYAEDNSTSEATNPPYAFAWRYRDWVIEAMNKDTPYDKFVKLQLGADLMPELRAMITAPWAIWALRRFITRSRGSPKKFFMASLPTIGTSAWMPWAGACWA